MKNYTFEVFFTTGKIETVYTGSFEQARILAQAEQIKQGNMWEVSRITKMED